MAQAQQVKTQTQAGSLGPDSQTMTAKAARAVLAAWQDLNQTYADMTGQPLEWGPAERAAAEALGYGG